jgi:hypothetical protein
LPLLLLLLWHVRRQRLAASTCSRCCSCSASLCHVPIGGGTVCGSWSPIGALRPRHWGCWRLQLLHEALHWPLLLWRRWRLDARPLLLKVLDRLLLLLVLRSLGPGLGRGRSLL